MFTYKLISRIEKNHTQNPLAYSDREPVRKLFVYFITHLGLKMADEVEHRPMQVKVLYSFNDNPTVFLSRSTAVYSIKVAEIPAYGSEEMVTLGGYELKDCLKQILQSSPENFHLESTDYAVYYKDVTEQPDEPFVADGVLSDLLNSKASNLIPGRVCQNVSASFLFGNKKQNSLTLEVRLKLHIINNTDDNKRQAEQQQQPYQQGQPELAKRQKSSSLPVKASRTKSLPLLPPHYNNHMYSIRHADKTSTPSRYDSQSVLDRFKLASFVDGQAISKPKVVRRTRNQGTASRSNSVLEPVRAIRTRSMITSRQAPLMISSPIHEEGSSDTDDTEYNENNAQTIDEDEDDEDEEEEIDNNTSSPYTPQQPPYRPSNYKPHAFHSLPDLEDLDSKKTHSIPSNKLPENHGLVCVNPNCTTENSITWRYFEMGFHPNFFEIHRATEFNKKNYEGMYGPLCNACYLFLRSKGFMRPEQVVKKYLKQQRYKKVKELQPPQSTQVKRHSPQWPNNNNNHKFATPSHTPQEINQAIQNTKMGTNDLNDIMNQLNNFGGPLTDIDPLPDQLEGVTPPIMATKSNTRVINIDPTGEDKENCPPIDITQFHSSSSPGRDENAEFEKLVRSFNHPVNSERLSPNRHTDWMNSLFGGTTPKDVTPADSTELKSVHPSLPQMKTFSTRRSPRLNKHRTSTTMPSSPLLPKENIDDKFSEFLEEADFEMLEKEINDLTRTNRMFNNKNDSPMTSATRNDTTMSLYRGKRLDALASSSPSSEIFSDDNKHRRQEAKLEPLRELNKHETHSIKE